MGMFDFIRRDGLTVSVLQHFVDNKFPTRPICDANEFFWRFKDKMEL